MWAFETSKPSLEVYLLYQVHLLILPKQFTKWGPNIQICKPMREVLIKTTAAFQLLAIMVNAVTCSGIEPMALEVLDKCWKQWATNLPDKCSHFCNMTKQRSLA